jgi:uncharacterized RDD family membrane protein YckC
MVAQAPPAPVVTVVRVPYAGVATRAVGLAIDTVLVQGGLLIVAGVLALIGLLVGGIELGTVAKVIAGAVWLLATGGYFVTFWTGDGQTPGMRAMHVRVTTASGTPPGIARSVLRVVLLGLCIVTLFLGFLPVLFDDRRRGVHDMLARTVVAYDDGS